MCNVAECLADRCALKTAGNLLLLLLLLLHSLLLLPPDADVDNRDSAADLSTPVLLGPGFEEGHIYTGVTPPLPPGYKLRMTRRAHYCCDALSLTSTSAASFISSSS